MQSKKFLVIGTAGHIDHGKTSLIKALTGVDTDRWEEEKRRGMTIDLGFARLQLPNGILAGIVDVPGHEKFIKNMLAGAHGIDIVLFVVAADEGVMPQTKEHLTVCQMLGTKRGIVVLTKKDLVDEEWLELVKEEVKEFLKGSFLENAPVVAVSSKTGEGIEELVSLIERIAQEVEPKSSEGIVRLPVDRSFTVKGFGTVVTGTLLSGKLKVGDSVEILPSGKKIKVRGIQVHGEAVDSAVAGQRTAVNLSEISKEEVERGDLLATPGYLEPSNLVDVEITLSKDADMVIQSGHKVHFHHLTSEVEGEIYLIDKDELLPGETAFAQVRLSSPVVAVFGDRFVVRNYSPARVIGGGWIVDPLPGRKFRRRFRKEWFKKLSPLASENLEEKLLHLLSLYPGKLSSRDFVQRLGISEDEAERIVSSLEEKGEIIVSQGFIYPSAYLESLKEELISVVKEFHNRYPVLEGVNRESLRTKVGVTSELLEKLTGSLIKEGFLEEVGAYVKLKDFEPGERGIFKEAVPRIESLIRDSGFTPPQIKEISKLLSYSEDVVQAALSYLVERKGFRKFGDFVISPEAFSEMLSVLRRHFSKKETLSVGEFKDYLGVSRKFAIPLLEYLDREGYTERKGNDRVRGEKL